jgi:glycosyltransferase involved in cell wall biosynthesis
MRILHLLPTFNAGGAERMVLEFARAQHERGHEVIVASAGGNWVDRLDHAEHVTVPSFGALPGRSAAATLAMRKLVRSTRPQLINAHIAGLGAIARLVSPRTTVLVTVHGLLAADYDRAVRLLRLSRTHTVAVSKVVEDELRDRGLGGSRLHHIYNGATLLPANDQRVAQMAAHLGVSRERPVLVGMGRLVPAKGFPTLVEAAALLDDVDLVIAGEGAERENLENLAKELDVDLRLPGIIDDVPALLQLATVLVATSTVEGASIAVLEAVSLGVACVVTPVCTHEELVEAGAVVVVPPGEPRVVADALQVLLDDPEALQALRGRSAGIAHRFSVTRMVDQYEALGARLARH